MVQWNVVSAFVLDQLFGYQSANKLRENPLTILSGKLTSGLGGSREIPNNAGINLFGGPLKSKQNGLGPFDAVNYIDIEIDGTNQTGVTYQARVEVRTERAGCTITPKIRNMTDSTDAGTGVACSTGDPAYGGTNQKQTIALTIASGVKKYRLQFTLGQPSGTTWAIGYIERLVTA